MGRDQNFFLRPTIGSAKDLLDLLVIRDCEIF